MIDKRPALIVRCIGADDVVDAIRSATFNISIDNTWQDPERTNEMISWARAAWSELRERTGGGVYSNFAGFGEDNVVLAGAVYGSNYERLLDVKRRYDSDDLFRGNVRISPS